MNFYKNLNKSIGIFFIFERRINENKKKNRKRSIDLIKSFKKINHLYPYSIN